MKHFINKDFTSKQKFVSGGDQGHNSEVGGRHTNQSNDWLK